MKNVVTVSIGDEQYSIRTDASPEYTLECAAYVDRTIAEIVEQGSLVEAHKAAILAAMALADQLFQARGDTDAVRAQAVRLAERLTADIEARLAAS